MVSRPHEIALDTLLKGAQLVVSTSRSIKDASWSTSLFQFTFDHVGCIPKVAYKLDPLLSTKQDGVPTRWSSAVNHRHHHSGVP